MLGCFVGPAETAARGVPERFVGKAISGVTVKQEESEEVSKKPDAKASASAGPGLGQGASAAEPMAVDA